MCAFAVSFVRCCVGCYDDWQNGSMERGGAVHFWPELEADASCYRGGTNDGKNQVFLTPGLMVSKIKLRKEPKDRLGMVFGTGMQIATLASIVTTTVWC